MKKVRLNLKRGIRSWSFVLYDSAESAFYLKDEPLTDDEAEEFRRVVTLAPGELLEIEWVGSEWVYCDPLDGSTLSTSLQHKFDKVRIGKLTPIRGIKGVPSMRKASCVEVYVGWVTGSDLRWDSGDTQDVVRITRIKGRMRPRLDFSKLFDGHPDDDGPVDDELQPSNSETVVLN